MNRMSLHKQLRAVGAGETEARQLEDTAKLLSSIKTRGLSRDAKNRLAPSLEAAKAPHTWQWTVAGSLAMACFLLFAAANILPGDWMNGRQKATEETRAATGPDQNDGLLQQREEEVERLIQEKADPAVLEEAEKSYQEAVEQAYGQTSDDTRDTDQRAYQPRYDWARRWFSSWQNTRNSQPDVRGSNYGR